MCVSFYFKVLYFQLVTQTGSTENIVWEAEKDQRLRPSDGHVRDHHHGHRERVVLRRGVQQGGHHVHRSQDAHIHLHCGAASPYCGLPYARNTGTHRVRSIDKKRKMWLRLSAKMVGNQNFLWKPLLSCLFYRSEACLALINWSRSGSLIFLPNMGII